MARPTYAMLPAALAALALSAPSARADHDRPLAEPTVREMISTEIRSRVVRAAVGAERGRHPHLEVEAIRRGRGGRWTLAYRERVDRYRIGRRSHDMEDARRIELRRFRGRTLVFDLEDDQHRRMRCRVRVGRRARDTARCRVHGSTQPPPTGPDRPQYPEPRPRDWSGVDRVQDACERAMSGERRTSRCLDAVADASFDPTSLVSACDRAMTGDGAELSCIRTAASARSEPIRALSACERAMSGDDAEIACLGHAMRASYDPTGAIEACERSLSGDSQELACVEVAVKFRRDPSRTIRQCARRGRGDDEEMRCIERSLRRR